MSGARCVVFINAVVFPRELIHIRSLAYQQFKILAIDVFFIQIFVVDFNKNIFF